MTMSTAAKSKFRCATCDIDINGRPTIHVGLAFCCAGCVAGGPCTCSYDTYAEVEDLNGEGSWKVHDCLDVTALDADLREVAAARR